MPDFGVSPLTHTIFMGKSKPVKNGRPGDREWIGAKQDVTDAVLKAVFELMHLMSEKTGACSISIPGIGTMKFVREVTK